MFVVFSIRMRRIRSGGGINEQGRKDSMEQVRSTVSRKRRENEDIINGPFWVLGVPAVWH